MSMTKTMTAEPTVWMTDQHALVVTLPMGCKNNWRERDIRARLKEGIQIRFPAMRLNTFVSFVDAVASGELTVMEDEEHGHQYGVVLTRVDTHPDGVDISTSVS